MARARLSRQDYEKLLDVLGAISEARDPDQFAQVVPAVVPSLVPADATSLNDVDPIAGVVRAVVKPDNFPVPDHVAVALEELAGDHPLIRHMSQTGDGSAVKISDFWTIRRWRDSEVYHRVYAPMGIEYQMALALPAPRPAVVGLALNRVEARSDFTEHDRELLDRLRPHLTQSWRNARDHAHVHQLLDTAGHALAVTGNSVLLLSDPVHELTPGALTELYRYLGRPADCDPLPPRVQRWVQRERHRKAADLSYPLRASRSGRQLTLRYLPGYTGDPEALLLSVTELRQLPTQLRSLGLSAREVEVLELVTTGATNSEIAVRLHLAPATVRHHLEHVYRKLGVTGRVQASALALHNLPSSR